VLVHAVPHDLVVRVGQGQEVHAAAAQLGDGAELVVGAQREVLHAGGHVVPLEVLLDLALLLALGRLVDRHLDEVVAAGHDLGHQRGVLGRDVLVVEVLEHLEAHDVSRTTAPSGSSCRASTLPTQWSTYLRPQGLAACCTSLTGLSILLEDRHEQAAPFLTFGQGVVPVRLTKVWMARP
jgi:hypothetical protein